MSVQRDVNPETDNKLNKMLDAKFGKRDRTIVTGDDVRKALAVIKSLEAVKSELEKQVRTRIAEGVRVKKPSKPSSGRRVGTAEQMAGRAKRRLASQRPMGPMRPSRRKGY